MDKMVEQNETPPSDARLAAEAALADEVGDTHLLREALDRAPWREQVPDDILNEFLAFVYGSEDQ